MCKKGTEGIKEELPWFGKTVLKTLLPTRIRKHPPSHLFPHLH